MTPGGSGSSEPLPVVVEPDGRAGVTARNRGVLLLYTGGTLGSAPGGGRANARRMGEWFRVRTSAPTLDRVPFRIDVACLPEPTFSADFGPREWLWMASCVERHYEDYEGFVVVQGTDTMAHTASLLSFVLGPLAKPVILTGSQASMVTEIHSDGPHNLLTALLLANPAHTRIPVVPEVSIYFGGRLLRGNRTTKVDSDGFGAFASPAWPPLAEVGVTLRVAEPLLLAAAPGPLRLSDRLEPRVIVLKCFPGIEHLALFDTILERLDVAGVVLETYGGGNVPTRGGLVSQLGDAVRRGIPIVNVNQCFKGDVDMKRYETGAQLLDVGVWNGRDMTTEAAWAKMVVLLGEAGLDRERLRHQLERPLRGELGETGE